MCDVSNNVSKRVMEGMLNEMRGGEEADEKRVSVSLRCAVMRVSLICPFSGASAPHGSFLPSLHRKRGLK